MRGLIPVLGAFFVLFATIPGLAQVGLITEQIGNPYDYDGGVPPTGQRTGCYHENPRVAIPACTRMLSALRRDRGSIYAWRARAYANRGDLERALEDYERAIRLSNDDYAIYAMRGHDYLNAEKYHEALASFNESIAINPDAAGVLNSRAWLLATSLVENIRNGPQAVADALKAVELIPERPTFFDTLAAAYAENGQFEKAVQVQQRAMSLLPSDNLSEIEDYESRLDLYLQMMPYRDEPVPEADS